MRKKYVVPFLMMLFLFVGAVQVQATAADIQTESVTLTEGNRYRGEYYQKPEERYPVAKARSYGAKASEQTLEEYVVKALEQFETQIDISSYQIPVDEAGTVFFQILNNNPQLFYVQGKISYSYNSSTNRVMSFKITYTDTPEEVLPKKQAFHKAADKAVAQVDSSMSDVEKALVVHDYLVQSCEYDYENLLNNNVPAVSHTAYGALVENMAVCDGYGKAYLYLMKNRLGISCELVSSDEMNHAWNMIQIGGEWYHVDATWDDPTWDSIGRVAHKYFLLSDSAISDAAHDHNGWVTTRTADSTLYDAQFWADINSSIYYLQGDWYYSFYHKDTRQTDLVKRTGLLDGTEEKVYTEPATWNYYTNSFMYLSKVYNRIYFNTTTTIQRLDVDGTITEVYKPTIPSGELIFGFTVRGEQLCYALQQTPNLSSKQLVLTYGLPELKPQEIKDVSAEAVKTVYDGTAKQITVNGLQAGDLVQYAGADGIYSAQQPEMVNAGVYEVLYKVERLGYEIFYGNTQLEIEKAVPQYTVPTGLKGKSGAALKDVALPKGFSWQTDPSTKLKEEGTFQWIVKYVPEDVANYKEVWDLEVEVAVSCPGHQYTSRVTKEATETQKGLKAYTCNICGNTYTEDIPMLQPQKPEKVSGLKVKKKTVDSLTFTWKKASKVSYRLVFYKGSKKVSTKYTSKNTYTYKNLKSATDYILKVKPYRVVNGKKIYAAKECSVKTATVPVAAKLSKVKKSGTSKAKLTWKKVTGASGYEVFMKTGKAGYKKVKTITNGKTVTYTKTGLKKGKTYSFRLRTYRTVSGTKIYGAYSNSKSLKFR